MPELRGPNGPITYERDELGYPRITVRDDVEGAWARGYFHALDRLVQIRLTHAISQGRMMELLGDVPMARAIDRFVRTFDFASDADARIRALTDETRVWLESYCAGFAAGERERGRPWPLRLLGLKPGPYEVRDIITVYRLVSFFGLTSLQTAAELTVAELVGTKAPRRVLDLLLGDAAEGLDLDALGDLRLDPELQLLTGHVKRGSNAFAVSGARSRSAGALLMGEFHMEVGKFPPNLYAFHLDYTSGGYLQGMSVPGFAWLSAGRTPDIGWSYTYAHADNIDVRVAKELAPVSRRVETVAIKGKPSETWTFASNAHGTRIGPVGESGEAAHLRWAGLGDIHKDLEVCRAVVSANNVDELVALHRTMKVISLEAVFADRGGRIAIMNTGQVDARDGWTGAYPARVTAAPVPVGEETRPVSIDPPEGFVASANQGSAWATLPEPAYRHDRLVQILDALDGATLTDLVQASYDDRDLCMERLAPVWEALMPGAEKIERGLFHALHEQVVVALLARDLGLEAAVRFSEELGGTLLFEAHLDRALALERPELLGEDELRAALAEALPRARERVARTWPVHARFSNTITQGKEPAFLGLSSAQMRFPGGPTSVFQSRRVDFMGQELLFGPAFHLVFDMSQPGAWYHVPGGASERRFGPGYGRGVDLWCEGRFLPLGSPRGEPPTIER